MSSVCIFAHMLAIKYLNVCISRSIKLKCGSQVKCNSSSTFVIFFVMYFIHFLAFKISCEHDRICQSSAKFRLICHKIVYICKYFLGSSILNLAEIGEDSSFGGFSNFSKYLRCRINFHKTSAGATKICKKTKKVFSSVWYKVLPESLKWFRFYGIWNFLICLPFNFRKYWENELFVHLNLHKIRLNL